METPLKKINELPLRFSHGKAKKKKKEMKKMKIFKSL